ncbi:MAG: M23 family metallopeptidase [Cyanobacteria bacterium J06650_10]
MYWLRPLKSRFFIRFNHRLRRIGLKSLGLSSLGLSSAVALSGMAASVVLPQRAIANESCPAALEQFRRYSATGNETISSIAATYNLFPETLLRFNPGLSSTTATPAAGSELLVPPFNGRVVNVDAGESWASLAERYGSRADVLFEVNGCVSQLPDRIFLPGAMPITATATQPNALQLQGYPLSQTSDIALSYGWQPHPERNELVFNGGLAFSVSAPMAVQSVGPGTVAFVGEREGYGRLLVINHEQGLQTRYANLSDISVSVGQSVAESMVVGSVGNATNLATNDAESNTPTYLYFEVRTNSASGWIAQDPGKYLPALELR